MLHQGGQRVGRKSCDQDIVRGSDHFEIDGVRQKVGAGLRVVSVLCFDTQNFGVRLAFFYTNLSQNSLSDSSDLNRFTPAFLDATMIKAYSGCLWRDLY